MYGVETTTITTAKPKRDTSPKTLQSRLLNKYVERVKKDSTRKEIRQRLVTFEEFVKQKYKTLVDTRFINNRLATKQSEAKGNKIYVYDMFIDYVEYLTKKNLSRERIQYLLIYARRSINFFLDEDLSKDKFNDKVKPTLPDSEHEDKTLITNDDIKRLIYACGNDLKLRTLITVLGSTGARIGEILKIKYKYLKLEWTKENNIDIPPYIYIPAFITKTRRERKAYLTTEAVQCLKDWLEYKYRPRRIVKQLNGKFVSLAYEKPSDISESYVFRMIEDNPTSEEEIEEMEKNMNLGYRFVYRPLQIAFKELVEKEQLGKKFRNKKNNSVSIHSLRWYVVNTVEDLTNLTSAYFWVGKRQRGYIFPDRDNKKILELYRKVELSLTFLNPNIIKQTGLKEIEELRQQIRQQRKEFLIYQLQKEEDSYQEFIVLKYERTGVNIAPAIPEIPKDVVKSALEHERKDDPNVTVEEMCFIRVKDLVERLKLSAEDEKILDEYIREEFGDYNLVCLTFSLPSYLAGMSEITPDEVRGKIKLLKQKTGRVK